MLQVLIRSFHLYHNWPIDKTEKFGRERAANARNSIALDHLHSASLHCRGRRVVPCRSATASLQRNEGREGRRGSRIASLSISPRRSLILDPRSRFRQRDLVAIDFGVDPGRQKAEAQAARAPSYGLSPPLLAVDAAKDAFAQADTP